MRIYCPICDIKMNKLAVSLDKNKIYQCPVCMLCVKVEL